MSKISAPLTFGCAMIAATLFSALLPSIANGAIINVSTEAIIRGGSNSGDDQAESDIRVKYNPTPFNTARNGYFQFDLSGQNADLSAPATLTFITSDDRAQVVQLWALDQAYPTFASTVSWDTAQAKDTGSNDLLTTGPFTASTIGSPLEVPSGSVGDAVVFNLASLTPYVFSDTATFVLTGVDDTGAAQSNNSGGLRLVLGASQLEFTAVPEPSSLALISLTYIALFNRKRS